MSFLENFSDSRGHMKRKAFYGNQWARDKQGDWHEITQAEFTGDNIANLGYRLDFSGGVGEGRFFMRNGGFKVGELPLNSDLVREVSANPPDIPFSKLP